MNLREAAQQALEALEKHGHAYFKHEEQYNKAIMALHFALCDSLEPVTTCHELSKEGDKLSLPFNHFPDAGKMVATCRESRQVEPVAFIHKNFERRTREVLTEADFGGDKLAFLKYCMSDGNLLPLYTAPPMSEPLTDWEIEVWAQKPISRIALCRAIERAHGIGGEE